MLVGCGDPTAIDPPGVDARIEVRVDPFEGMFIAPAAFPHEGCIAGSLAGFGRVGYWPALGMRTELGDALRAYVANDGDELAAETTLTAEDLVIRATEWTGTSWRLKAIDVCGVDEDGTLHGAMVTCEEQQIGTCQPEPFAAVQLRRITGEGVGEHLTQLGELLGDDWGYGVTTSVRVQGDVAYLARGSDGLRVISIANPAAPVELAHLHGGNRAMGDLELVRGVDGLRYLIAGSLIIGVTDPMNPQVMAEVPFDATAVAVEFPTAYFVDGVTSRVEAYDISLPQSPKRIARYDDPGDVVWRDVFVAGGIAYLSDARGSGMHVVDFGDPARPRELGTEQARGESDWHTPSLTLVGGKPVALDVTVGRASKLRMLDGEIGAATFLDTLGEWKQRDLVSMQHIVAVGSRVYVANDRDGVRVVNISQPALPTLLGYFNTWTAETGGARFLEGAVGIDVDRVRKRIYVADTNHGLVILQGDAIAFP